MGCIISFFFSFLSFHLPVDFLLCWIWIVLHWNIDQCLGYSGLNIHLNFFGKWKHLALWLNITKVHVHFFCLFAYSKYICTSVAVVRLLRWSRRLQEEHWGLQDDKLPCQALCLNCYCKLVYIYIADEIILLRSFLFLIISLV